MKKINTNIDVLGNFKADGFIKNGTSQPLYVNHLDLVGKTITSGTVFLAEGKIYEFNDINRTNDGNLTTLISKSKSFDNDIGTWTSGRKYAVGDVVSYLNKMYVCATTTANTTTDPLTDNGANWTVMLSGGSSGGGKQTIKLTGQTIKSGLPAYTPVFFNNLSLEWDKCVDRSLPVGFYAGISGEIILGGLCSVVGFTPYSFYFLNTVDGTISTTKTEYKIGYSISATEFLVDIDIESTLYSSTNNLSLIGSAGYILGGNGGLKRVDKFNFSNESITNKGDILTSNFLEGAGFNSDSNGYASGRIGSSKADIIKYNFANDASSVLSTMLATPRESSAVMNSTIRGYIAGGYTGTVNSNVINSLTFANDASTQIAATLVSARAIGVGVNSSIRGYAMGGYISAATSEIDGINFADETAINPSATIGAARYRLAGVNSSTKAYVMGGTTSGPVNRIDGFRFSDETATTVSATLVSARSSVIGVNSNSIGYAIGGDSPSSEIDGINFADETAINPAASLSVARYNGAGFQSGGIL